MESVFIAGAHVCLAEVLDSNRLVLRPLIMRLLVSSVNARKVKWQVKRGLKFLCRTHHVFKRDTYNAYFGSAL
jgi:hypothetical protein